MIAIYDYEAQQQAFHSTRDRGEGFNQGKSLTNTAIKLICILDSLQSTFI